MSYEVYKIIHLVGIVLVLTGLTGMLSVKMAGANLEGATRRLVFLSHGIGLLFVLVSGFGLLARLNMAQSMPNWVFGKIAIWLIFGGVAAVIKRKAKVGTFNYLALVGIFAVAAYLAVAKPF